MIEEARGAWRLAALLSRDWVCVSWGASGGGTEIWPLMRCAWTPEEFYREFDEPPHVQDITESVQAFVETHRQAGHKVVLVTSGGTTVPLEKNMVRFLDNFSAGTRGAASAEYFLQQGYAVLFLSRQHSQFPFTRLYSHTTNPLFDLLEEPVANDDLVRVSRDHVADLLPTLHAYHDAKRNKRLLTVSFVTVVEYLFLLRHICHILAPLGRHAMLYLAAAVSDYFLPPERMSEHKIQSSDGALTIELQQVPKVLGVLVREWLPHAYVVSFKLETDESLVIPKAERSLRHYGHQLVIGNQLQRRKWEVVLVEHTSRTKQQDTASFEHAWIQLPQDAEHEIERDIARMLAQRQHAWIHAV